MEIINNCDCGLTGGCEKCNPRPSFIGCISDKEAEEMKNRVSEWEKRFNESFERRAEMLKHYGNN